MTSGRKRLLSLGVTVFFLLVASEVSLQLLAVAFAPVERLLSPTYMTSQMVPDDKLGHRPNPTYFDHDTRGFRNASLPGHASRVNIVALGDSQTYGVGVQREQAWPQHLSRLSHTSTYNMAFGGYGPLHSVLLVDECLELKPKIIIEALYSGNDLFDSYRIVYDLEKMPSLKSTDEKIIGAIRDAEKEETILKKSLRLSMMDQAQEAPAAAPGLPGKLRELLSNHSKLYGLLRAIKNKISHKESVQSKNLSWEAVKQKALENSEYCDIFAGEQWKTVFTLKYRLCGLDLKDPRIAEGERLCLEGLKLLQEGAAKADTVFLVLLIPTKELVFKEVVEKDSARFLAPDDFLYLVQNEEKLWQTTREYMEAHGIQYVDALPALRECFKRGEQPYEISVDGHPDPTGHAAIAKAVLDELRHLGLLE